jgi:hypothetical protein
MIVLALTIGVWAWSRFYWMSICGPTDASHLQTKVEVMVGRLCAGREEAIMGVWDGSGGGGPIYANHPRWTIRIWRNDNTLAYEENWGPSRGGFVWRFVLPLWMPLIPVGVWVAWVVRAVWRTRRPRPHACPKCGYDLRGLPTGRCPECGTPASI